MLDPVARAIANAPIEDEPVTEEERQAVARSEAWFEERGGKGIPMQEVRHGATVNWLQPGNQGAPLKDRPNQGETSVRSHPDAHTSLCWLRRAPSRDSGKFTVRINGSMHFTQRTDSDDIDHVLLGQTTPLCARFRQHASRGMCDTFVPPTPDMLVLPLQR
jgi:hypothetical protein